MGDRGRGERRSARPARSPSSRADALDKRHKKLLKIGGKKAQLEEAEFHELRLEFKKMRYLSEFFSSLFAKKGVRRYLEAHGRRRRTGWDRSTTHWSAARCSAQMEPSLHDALGEPRRPAGSAACCWAGRPRSIERDLDHFEDVWREFRRQKRYWRKRALVVDIPGRDEVDQLRPIELAPGIGVDLEYRERGCRILLAQVLQAPFLSPLAAR